ncbi:MAG TPA: hypothetical protein VHV28_07435 [Solirubrobacteraceae bacterium]|jgi:hypothetical protein|nr:hypothetical protein [Solirubrobacteraceae bacterium]
MSIQAVLSRIDVIAQAQQQLVSPTGSSAATNANAIGSTLSGTAAAAGSSSPTSFASALAQAQGTPLAGTSTATGLTATSTATGLPGTDATSTAGVTPGAVVPQAAWNPEQKQVAGWISPILDWASQHGWSGSVTSGYRDYQQQAAINASGAFSAPAGKSNHETTQYPGGAVDVTDPSQLIDVLKGYTGPYKLVGGVLGAADPEHFSATGH